MLFGIARILAQFAQFLALKKTNGQIPSGIGNDVLNLIEELMVGMVSETSVVPLASTTFPRLSFKEAVEKYGTDRPDLRYDLEIHDISDIAGRSGFSVFVNNVAAGLLLADSSAPSQM